MRPRPRRWSTRTPSSLELSGATVVHQNGNPRRKGRALSKTRKTTKIGWGSTSSRTMSKPLLNPSWTSKSNTQRFLSRWSNKKGKMTSCLGTESISATPNERCSNFYLSNLAVCSSTVHLRKTVASMSWLFPWTVSPKSVTAESTNFWFLSLFGLTVETGNGWLSSAPVTVSFSTD